jgi:GT2 family glycosyltransferase
MSVTSERDTKKAPVRRSGLRAAASAEAGARAVEGPRHDDFDALFALADRRRRVQTPSARDLLFVAQALRAAGRGEAAQQQLDAALAQDPGDLALDRAALMWGSAASRRAAAERVVGRLDLDADLRARAAAAILQSGGVAQRWRRTEQGVAGWIAWVAPHPLPLEFHDGGRIQTFIVEPDPGHPLSGPGVAAADVEIETDEPGPFVVSARVEGATDARLPARAAPEPPPFVRGDVDLTIVVPVYDDFAATRACLDALRLAPPAISHRVVAVDDDSPDAAIRAYLDEAAAAGVLDLIRNPVNLGYAGSVNRALATRAGGDVLLLNADALPPPGAVDRLAALCRAAPDVGAVTPFSNNGELTSYPVRHQANPLPSAPEIAALDAHARAANGDALVDLPNGVGFCLYVSAACVDAVGAMPEIYGQGYYEDVEFCLRAREKGLRTVAAPGVYVGHAGSRSFGARKRALVARNLKRIEARFPGYALETAAFVSLDPLGPFRAALDRAAPPAGPVALVACGPRAAARMGALRAEVVARELPGDAVLVLTADPRGRVSLFRAGGGAPQSLVFEEPSACVAYLAALDLAQVEYLDPASLPDEVLSALLARDAEFVLPCGDLSWFAVAPAPPEGPCVSPLGEGPCDVCRAVAAPRAEAGAERRRAKLGRALERAHRILPLDRLAARFAGRVFKSRVAPFETPPPPVIAPARRTRLGVLYPQRTPAIDRLLRRLGEGEDGPEIVVLGATLDDRAAMATGRLFVTGPVEADDILEVARLYRIDALLGPDRAGGFGELEAAAAVLGAPKAYFDWTFGALEIVPGDLSLDPRICDVKAVARIAAWMLGDGAAAS